MHHRLGEINTYKNQRNETTHSPAAADLFPGYLEMFILLVVVGAWTTLFSIKLNFESPAASQQENKITIYSKKQGGNTV